MNFPLGNGNYQWMQSNYNKQMEHVKELQKYAETEGNTSRRESGGWLKRLLRRFKQRG